MCIRDSGCAGGDGVALLMEQGGEEPKLRLVDLKAAASLVDAALAEDDDLFTAPERVDHDGPFLECCPHAWVQPRPSSVSMYWNMH